MKVEFGDQGRTACDKRAESDSTVNFTRFLSAAAIASPNHAQIRARATPSLQAGSLPGQARVNSELPGTSVRTCRAPITGPRAGDVSARLWAEPPFSPVSSEPFPLRHSDWQSLGDVTTPSAYRCGAARPTGAGGSGVGEPAVQRGGALARCKGFSCCCFSLCFPRR